MYVNWPICGSSLTILENPQLPRGMQIQGMAGLGCDCRGGCRGGLGLFDTGLDLTGWGWAEWAAVIVGVYVVFSVFSSTKRTVGRVRSGFRQRAQRRERRSELLSERAQIDRELRGGGRAPAGRRRVRGGAF